MYRGSTHIDEIKKAISHNTGMLVGGEYFTDVVLDTPEKYNMVTVTFDGFMVTAKYIIDNTLEVLIMGSSKGAPDKITAILEKYVVTAGTDPSTKTTPNPQNIYSKLQVHFKDLNQVQYTLLKIGSMGSENEKNPDGTIALVQMKTAAKKSGFTTALFFELVDAFREYKKNIETNVIDKDKTNAKMAETLASKKENSETKILEDCKLMMIDLYKSVGLATEGISTPEWSVESIQKFICDGLTEAGKASDHKEFAKEMKDILDIKNLDTLRSSQRWHEYTRSMLAPAYNAIIDALAQAKRLGFTPQDEVRKAVIANHPAGQGLDEDAQKLASRLNKCIKMAGVNSGDIKTSSGQGIGTLDINKDVNLIELTSATLNHIADSKNSSELKAIAGKAKTVVDTTTETSKRALLKIVSTFGKELNKVA